MPRKTFSWFVQEVANMRRKGDVEADKALLAEVYKFEDLEEIGDAYQIEFRKNNVTINRPFQVGIVVYQLAKLRMLQFYYDLLDHYLDRRDYELIQMDTDSMYFALSYDTLEEAVKPELLKDFEREKKRWLSLDKWSSREPGLFKLESEGTSELEYDFSHLMQEPKYTVNTEALEMFAKALTPQQLVAIIPPINVPILIQVVQSKESEGYVLAGFAKLREPWLEAT